MVVSGQLASRLLHPGKRLPVPIEYVVEWTPKFVEWTTEFVGWTPKFVGWTPKLEWTFWRGEKFLTFAGIQIPYRCNR